jgi:hypothetical protein
MVEAMPTARRRLAAVPLAALLAAGAPPAEASWRPPAQASSRPPAQASWRPPTQASSRPPAQASWRTPVEGAAVTRAFDLGANPFEGGRHRGVDLAAVAGSAVRAPCAGEVVVAGRVGTSGRVVTVRCGPWRVSHMPLATIATRRGEHVRAGTPLGTAAPSRAHAGLHLGVRREGDRFGYVDPLAFLAAGRRPPPLAGRRPPPIRVARPPRLGPAPRAPRPANSPLRRAGPEPAGSDPLPRRAGPEPAGSYPLPRRAGPEPAGSNPLPRRGGGGGVPWPAWVGAALMLGGLGFRWRAQARMRGGLARRFPVEGIR